MDTSTTDIDPKLDCGLLQQILTELRDFRKEYNEGGICQESAVSRQLAAQTDNENALTNSNHSLPEIPLPGPNPPLLSVPEQMPGHYPSTVATEQRTSGVDLDTRTHLSDVDVATHYTSEINLDTRTHLSDADVATHYTSEIKMLKNEIEQKKQLWEEAQKKNVELSKQVAEQQTKMDKLQQIMARAGRSDKAAIDSDISTQFLQLRSDILQIVKNHFCITAKTQHPSASPDLGELILRKELASALYKKMFSTEAMLFGFDDKYNKNPMKNFETRLREGRCDESVIKEWRIATVKACKLLDRNLQEYSRKISDQIWSETLSKYCYHSMSKKQETTRSELDSVCEKAANIAISFRGSAIEYEWEQDGSCLLQSRAFVTKDHEIIGTVGPNPSEETNFAIAFIVFGGIVRGDKGTGLLENGRIRLGRSQVVIGYTN